MFKCTECGRMTEPGTKMTRFPVEVRPVTTVHNQMDPNTGRVTSNTVGRGFETAKEGQFCPECGIIPPNPRVVERINRVHTYA